MEWAWDLGTVSGAPRPVGTRMRRQLLLLGPKRKRGKRARQRLGWRRERIRKQISIRTERAV